jgi:hypothetical protein
MRTNLKLRLVENDYRSTTPPMGLPLVRTVKREGPTARFVSLTRNMELAQNPPSRFEPTVKAIGDVVI